MKKLAILLLVALTGATSLATVPLTRAGAQLEPTAVTTSPGVLRGWGSNGNQQMGTTNTTLCTTVPSVACPTPYTSVTLFGVTQVSAGAFHTLFLRADGTVWAVGNNQSGQLGSPSSSGDQSQPVRVVDGGGNGLIDIIAVAAGPYHGLALDDTGHVWQWGQGLTTSASMVSGISTAAAIAAGGDNALFAKHNLALLDDGTVVAWGSNGAGQLGNGTNGDSSSPVTVSDLTDVSAIAAGRGHSLALLEDGTVKAWGENEYGQLGNGTTNDSNVPVNVSGLTGITSVAAGNRDSWPTPSTTASFSLARKNDGTVWGWGANYTGQLGNNTISSGATSTPVQAQGITTATSVAAGGGHSLALLSDHTVMSWGRNEVGQLGGGTTTSRSVPGAVAFAAPAADITQVTGGGNHSFAIASLGSLGEYKPLTPARYLDTRPGNPTFDGQAQGGGAIPQNSSVDVQITGRGDVPSSGVVAVVFNATVAAATQDSYLTVWPTGGTRPLVSNLNFGPGQIVPNLVTVALGVGGKVSVYNNQGATHVVFDVVGYYSSLAGGDGDRVHMIEPRRLLDTRPGNPTFDGQFQGQGKVGPGSTIDLDVTRGAVPDGVTGVVLNVTATEGTEGTFATVFPGDVSLPTASNLNFGPGQTVPNLVIVRVPPSGIVKLFNKLGTVHLIADVFGYYDGDESTEAGRVIPLFPGRAFDTRVGGGPLGPGSTFALDFGNFNAGIRNSQASGYAMNTTITQPSNTGFLTVYPFATVRPLVSNLNFSPGQTVPNLVMVQVGATCKVGFFNSPTGFTHLLSDLFGVITNDLMTPPIICPPVFTGSVDDHGPQQVANVNPVELAAPGL